MRWEARFSLRPSWTSCLVVQWSGLLAVDPLGVPLVVAVDGRHLGPSGLDGEVRLGQGDLGLPRVGVLGDQVAGVARQAEIGPRGRPPERFAGAGKKCSS